MTHDSNDGMDSASADLLQFVEDRLPELCDAFAQTPLMQLRVTTPEGSVTLEKAGSRASSLDAETAEPRRSPRTHDYLPDAEPGRAYTTVAADVVGIFHSAPDALELGAKVAPDQILGYIEALKVRTPVKAGVDGRLVAQVAEDGQPVDFGETLFVIDTGPIEALPDEPAGTESGPDDDIEPPRI
ncbi:MAG TPA: biotin/lipoyl-containing protein [Candidatus Eremiobacteraceae bacterium]|nr:biotin/lipoyl-containing protein [Candidatus Eremiobacteraceae bacterium]